MQRAKIKNILVICYGNIYRSAFVAAYLDRCMGSIVSIRSAGFHPVSGRPSPARHIELCRHFGVSLEGHRSSVATTEDLEWADLVLLMDRHNWAALKKLGVRTEKMVWLGSLVRGPVEIDDPYKLSDADAERIVARLQGATNRFVELTLQRGHY